MVGSFRSRVRVVLVNLYHVHMMQLWIMSCSIVPVHYMKVQTWPMNKCVLFLAVLS